MTTEQMERELAEVKQELRELKHSVQELRPAKKAGVLSIVGSMTDCAAFDEASAYGQYFRKTGQQPPPDWKPGDPIPEPAEGGA